MTAFIIDFIDSASETEISAYLVQNNITVKSKFSALGNIYHVESPAQPPASNLIEHLINDSVTSVKPLSYSVDSNIDLKDSWWKLASFRKPNLDAASNLYLRRGKNAIVYIFDSGVDSSHPDLIDANIVQLFSFNGDFSDVNGHGTAMASIISGKECGVTQAAVKSVKIFQKGADTSQADILAALNAIALDIAANPKSYPIVNVSWNIPKNTYIESKFSILQQAGVLIVVAAGNEGQEISNITPASLSCVTTVGAFGKDFTPCNFSNYTGPISTTSGVVNGGALDIWAPGEDIPVATAGGIIQSVSGTSISAAIVSAALAYNSDFNILSDGTPIPVALGANSFAVIESMSKKNILTLPNQFDGSINAIVCFSGENLNQSSYVYYLPQTFETYAVSGEAIYRRIYPTFSVQSFAFTKPLPNGLTLDNGWVTGTVVTDAPLFWEDTVQFVRNDGFMQTVIVKFGIVPVNFDPATATPGDEWTKQMNVNFPTEPGTSLSSIQITAAIKSMSSTL